MGTPVYDIPGVRDYRCGRGSGIRSLPASREGPGLRGPSSAGRVAGSSPHRLRRDEAGPLARPVV